MANILSSFRFPRIDRLTLILIIIFLAIVFGSGYFFVANFFGFGSGSESPSPSPSASPSPTESPSPTPSPSPSESPVAKKIVASTKPVIKSPSPSPVQSPSPSPSASPQASTSPSPSSSSSSTQLTPMIINGSAQFKAGELAPAGTEVQALIGNNVCGSTTTQSSGTTINFNMTIQSDTQQSGCGTTGTAMTFKIGGQAAQQNMPFNSGTYSGNVILNVTY